MGNIVRGMALANESVKKKKVRCFTRGSSPRLGMH